jgi:Uma2 family endonuclease
MRPMEATLTKRLTYSDYVQMTPPDSGKFQLIEGELVVRTSPSTKHQRIILVIIKYLETYIKKNSIGEIFLSPLDVVLGEHNTYQPDLLFILESNKKIIEETKINGTPDMVVEVLSPSNAYYDLVIKKKIYESSGVKEYWIVDPIQDALDLYVLQNNKFQHKVQIEKKGIIPSEIFPGLDLDLERILQ